MFAAGVPSVCLKKEYSESTRGLLSFSSAYITFNDCNGKYGEGTDCLRMSVFKAISLINDLTETGQKDNRGETYLWRGTKSQRQFRTPLHWKRCEDFHLYRALLFSGTNLCIWSLWSSCCYSLHLRLRELEAGTFRGSPDREVLGFIWGISGGSSIHSLSDYCLLGWGEMNSAPSYI